jgi:hypothetical protein
MADEVPDRVAFLDDPTDFSLVQGGPLFQLFLRTQLLRPPTDLLMRRIVAILLITWMPLLLFSLLSGYGFRGEGVPFLYDIGAQVRLLLFVPILLAADVIVHRRIKPVVRQFLNQGIVAPQDRPRFESVIASAMRLRNSAIAEALLLVLAITAGALLGNRYVLTDVPTWMAVPVDGRMQLTMAGYWNLFVSLTIVRFLLSRWYFRVLVWCYFLWQVSRHVPLRLNALHPDRAAGLGFLSDSVYAFLPVLFGHTLLISGTIASKILHDGATLPQFKMEIVAWMAFLTLVVLAPLCVFMTQLAEARRAGLREYGVVASRYVTDFRSKWIEGRAGKGEALVGSGDIQSLADLGNSFNVVREMGLVPYGRMLVLRVVIVTALPLALLTLTMVPLEQLIDRAFGLLF